MPMTRADLARDIVEMAPRTTGLSKMRKADLTALRFDIRNDLRKVLIAGAVERLKPYLREPTP